MTCQWGQREKVEVWPLSIRNRTLEGGGWSAPCSSCFSSRERAGTHCTEGRLGLGTGQHSMENLSSTGIWFLDRPAHSKLLCQLCCPGYLRIICFLKTDSQFAPPVSMLQFVVILQCLQVPFQFTFNKPTNFLCKNSICLLLGFMWTMPLCETPVFI